MTDLQYLLVDFGTTRVKAAIADLETGQISHITGRLACSAPGASPSGGEIPVKLFQEQFHTICTEYYELYGISFAGIMLSCQMHGFSVLADDSPACGYITWKDERSLATIDGVSSWDIFNQAFGGIFRSVTGMRPRPGLPVFNLLHLARQGALPRDSLVVSLSEVLCRVSNDATGFIHPTMLAGLGIYDINRQTTAEEFLRFIAAETGCKLRCCQSAPETQCGGYWHSGDGRKIPIYVGVGDHQCTVLGAGNIPGKTLSINMGTGSQVAAINFPPISLEQVEQRPYFGDSVLTTITHIPAGRALSEFIGFLEDVGRMVGDPGDIYWQLLAQTATQAALSAELEFDLGIFGSCWRYAEGGGIRRIHEGNFTLANYLAGLLGSFCRQYREAADAIDPQRSLKQCVVSGGIPQKLPQLTALLTNCLGREATMTKAVDESLIGLRTLALIAAGRAKDYQTAAAVFAAPP